MSEYGGRMSDEHRARLQAWLESERLAPRTEFTDKALYKEASAHVSTYDEEDETFEYIGIVERAENIAAEHVDWQRVKRIAIRRALFVFLFVCWTSYIIWIT